VNDELERYGGDLMDAFPLYFPEETQEHDETLQYSPVSTDIPKGHYRIQI
jgi:hypothetical protein